MICDFRSPLAALALTLALGGAFSAAAQPNHAPKAEAPKTAAAAPEPRAPDLPKDSTVNHMIELPGRMLSFRSVVGPVRLVDARTGAAQAEVVMTAFLLDGAEAAKRPVIFALNGGPGAGSAWLHLGAMGPWRVDFDGKAPRPATPALAIPNAETWLDFADLVFVDPPGTGFSRVTAQGDDARKRFYGVAGDIEGLAVAMRKWLAANNRLTSPKFIVGESYGGFRGPKLARALAREGVGVDGLMLVSPVLDFAWFDGAHNPLALAGRLPSYAAVARKLDGADPRAGLADVEAYAAQDYLVDLIRGGRDEQTLARMSGRVAQFTGLDAGLARRLGGRIDLESFSRERARAEGRVTSYYDGDVAGLDPDPFAATSERGDPVLDTMKTPLASAMAHMTANLFNWRTEGRYEILNESVNRGWDWGGGRRRPEAMTDLREALALDPDFTVSVLHGASDLVTPYFASKMLLDQLPATLGGRTRLVVTPGGHMFYTRAASRRAMREEGLALVSRRIAREPAAKR